MSETLRCPFCGRDADGLTLYSIAGVVRLLVCAACYGQLVAKEHQPHSHVRQRLQRLMASIGEEVVSDEGRGAGLQGNGMIKTHTKKEHLTCVS